MMEPRIVESPRILVMGVQCYGGNQDGLFPALWPIFSSLDEKITSQTEPHVYYGIESYTDEFRTQGKWFYLAGMGVTSLDDLPPQLSAKAIPAGRYAVFTHRGSLPVKLGQTFHHIYHEWLPASAYEQAGPFDFERYDDRFKGADREDSEMEVWVPVKQKTKEVQ